MLTLNKLQEILSKYLADNRVGDSPRELYEPADYIMELGGKRMRPLLLLAAYYMFDDHIERALPAAMGIEVFHNFTLAHDDIMDNAATRRGKESVHVAFDTNTAILTGDVMLISSFEQIMQASPDHALRTILEVFSRTAREICEGQQLDMNFENRAEVSVAEYVEMNSLKTGVLLGTALQIGALIANATSDEAQRLYDAGLSLGIAFQIQDDILDLYGDYSKFGKRRGGDIVNAKKTYLYTYTLEQLTGHQRETFIAEYHASTGNPEVKIQKVMRWFDQVGTHEAATRTALEKYEFGIEQFNALNAPSPRKAIVHALVDNLKSRLT